MGPCVVKYSETNRYLLNRMRCYWLNIFGCENLEVKIEVLFFLKQCVSDFPLVQSDILSNWPKLVMLQPIYSTHCFWIRAVTRGRERGHFLRIDVCELVLCLIICIQQGHENMRDVRFTGHLLAHDFSIRDWESLIKLHQI